MGARRPTTSTPTAAIWGDGERDRAARLARRRARHRVGAPGVRDALATQPGSLDGLVLLDLPDFDSRRSWRTAARPSRSSALVDLFVWVTDPQKYADARLHDDYVAALATHEAVTMVVLNQADRLTADGVPSAAPTWCG